MCTLIISCITTSAAAPGLVTFVGLTTLASTGSDWTFYEGPSDNLWHN